MESGFSLIELLVGMMILGVLIGVAAPNFKAWMLNTQIRSANESFLNGVQKARAEAIARNADVRFDVTYNPAGTVTGWNVVNPSTLAVIESRLMSEGTPLAFATITPPLAAPAVTSQITFDNVGMLKANADGSPSITQIDMGLDSDGDQVADLNFDNDPNQDANIHNFRVVFDATGTPRMCDPLLTNTSHNARACP